MSAGEELIGGQVADVQQAEAEVLAGRPIPVGVIGPVRVQQLPAASWSTRSRTVAAADGPAKVASADPRRRSLVLICTGGDMYVGDSDPACRQLVAAQWPAGLPLTLHHREDVYVSAASADIVVSTVEELWAE